MSEYINIQDGGHHNEGTKTETIELHTDSLGRLSVQLLLRQIPSAR